MKNTSLVHSFVWLGICLFAAFAFCQTSIEIRQSTSFTWDEGKWAKQSRDTYTYHADGDLTVLRENFDQGWHNAIKSEHARNALGLDAQQTDYVWENEVWVERSHTGFVYDGENRLVRRTRDDGHTTDYSYGSNGKLSEENTRAGDTLTRISYSYGDNDGDAALSHTTESTFHESQWIPTRRTEVEYIDDREVGRLVYAWQGDEWVPAFRLSRVYLGSGQEKESAWQIYENDQWIPHSREKKTYTEVAEISHAPIPVLRAQPTTPQRAYNILGRRIVARANRYPMGASAFLIVGMENGRSTRILMR